MIYYDILNIYCIYDIIDMNININMQIISKYMLYVCVFIHT